MKRGIKRFYMKVRGWDYYARVYAHWTRHGRQRKRFIKDDGWGRKLRRLIGRGAFDGVNVRDNTEYQSKI